LNPNDRVSGCEDEDDDSDSNSDRYNNGTSSSLYSNGPRKLGHRNSELDASLSRLALLEQELNNFEDNYVSRVRKNELSSTNENSKLNKDLFVNF
jgi:hypothetical protein